MNDTSRVHPVVDKGLDGLLYLYRLSDPPWPSEDVQPTRSQVGENTRSMIVGCFPRFSEVMIPARPPLWIAPPGIALGEGLLYESRLQGFQSSLAHNLQFWRPLLRF